MPVDALSQTGTSRLSSRSKKVPWHVIYRPSTDYLTDPLGRINRNRPRAVARGRRHETPTCLPPTVGHRPEHLLARAEVDAVLGHELPEQRLLRGLGLRLVGAVEVRRLVPDDRGQEQ